MALINHLGLNSHVCLLPVPGAPYNPTCKIMIPPAYPPHNTLDNEQEYKLFWWNNDICTYILTGKLSVEINSCLPPACGGPFNFPVWTVHNVSNWLQKRYSVGSASSVQKIKDSVLFLMCIPTTIPSYVQQWSIAINQLSVMAWNMKRFRNLLMGFQIYTLMLHYERRYDSLEMLDLGECWIFMI